MPSNNQRYDRLARWLDGEDISLSDAERAELEQFQRAEGRLAAMLDVRVPPGAMARARRRMVAELARPRRWARRLGVAAAIAAAAAIVVGVAVRWPADSPRPDGAAASVPLNVLVDVLRQSDRHEDLELLADQIDELAMEVAIFDDEGPFLGGLFDDGA